MASGGKLYLRKDPFKRHVLTPETRKVQAFQLMPSRAQTLLLAT